MEVVIHSKQVELSSRARLAIKSRVESLLGNLQQYVERVSVSFDDVNGPRGGADKQCLIKVNLIGMQPVVSRTQEDNAQTAFSTAFAIALRGCKKRLNKSRQNSHQSNPREQRHGQQQSVFER